MANLPACIWALYSLSSAASFCSSARSAWASFLPARRCLMQQKRKMSAPIASAPRTPAMIPIFAPLERVSNRSLTPWGDWISSRVSDLPLCLVSYVDDEKRVQNLLEDLDLLPVTRCIHVFPRVLGSARVVLRVDRLDRHNVGTFAEVCHATSPLDDTWIVLVWVARSP